jgi:hypothetical protein
LTTWADAVCTNQRDLPERSYQVQMIGDIHSNTRNVIIRVGDGTEYTEYVIDMKSSKKFRERLKDIIISQRRPFEEEIMVDVILKHVLCKIK